MDLFFYRDPEEAKEHEEEEQPAAAIEYPQGEYAGTTDFTAPAADWGGEANWAADAPAPTAETTWQPTAG